MILSASILLPHGCWDFLFFGNRYMYAAVWTGGFHIVPTQRLIFIKVTFPWLTYQKYLTFVVSQWLLLIHTVKKQVHCLYQMVLW